MPNPTSDKPDITPGAKDQKPTVTSPRRRCASSARSRPGTGRRAARGDGRGQVKDLTDRVASMERDARHKRFTDLVAGRGGANDGQPWFGDPGKHVALLETLADVAGEDGDEVKQYIEQQQGIAAQLKSSNLFTEIGSSQGGEADWETR